MIKNEHTEFLIKAAKKRGIQGYILKTDPRFCVLKKNKKQVLVSGGILSDNSGASSFVLANSKAATNEFLKIHKFPVPEQIKTNDFDKAKKFLKRYKKVVVKPLKLKQGKGITVGIETEKELKAAWTFAERFSPLEKVVEKHYDGIDHRVLVINYKHVFAVQRLPAYVVGNGKDSIKTLIKIRNAKKTPGKRKKPIKTDQVLKDFLKKQKMNLNFVPAENEKIILRGTANIHTGGESRDCTDELSAKVKKEVIEIAKLMKMDVIGIDYLAEDINKKRCLIELNSDPGVQLHHFPTHGKSREPIDKFLDKLF